MIASKSVTEAIFNAKTSGKKAAATRLKQQYVAQQLKLGHEPKRTEAAIFAVLTRMKNSKKRK